MGPTHLVNGVAVFFLFLLLAFLARATPHRFFRRLRVEESIRTLAAQVPFYLLLVIGLVTALDTLGVQTSALVASLGLGGFALGFALREAISNTLAGVLVMVYRPTNPLKIHED